MNKKIIQFNNFMKDNDKKGYSLIFKEIIDCWIDSKEFPIHYFTRLLYKKNSSCYKNFLSNKTSKKIVTSSKIQNSNIVNILDDKLIFNCMLKDKKDIKIPKLLSYNFKNSLWGGIKNMKYTKQL